MNRFLTKNLNNTLNNATLIYDKRESLIDTHADNYPLCNGDGKNGLLSCDGCDIIDNYEAEMGKFLFKGIPGKICSYAFKNPLSNQEIPFEEEENQIRKIAAIRYAMKKRIQRKQRQNINAIGFPFI